MHFKRSHNLLVRGSNPCGGTKEIADFRLAIADLWVVERYLDLNNDECLELQCDDFVTLRYRKCIPEFHSGFLIKRTHLTF
jgi:hypothetical protein